MQTQNQYLDFLTDSSFQEVNGLFVLSFENTAHRTSHKRYSLPIVEIAYYSIMIDRRSIFDQPVKTDEKTRDNIREIISGFLGELLVPLLKTGLPLLKIILHR